LFLARPRSYNAPGPRSIAAGRGGELIGIIDHLQETTSMMTIRKLGWPVLLLSAFVGCTKEEPGPAAGTSAPSETAPVSGTPAPETPPPATPAIDMKPDSGKAATTAPDMPKEAPAIEAPQVTPATKDDKASAVSLTAEEVAAIKKLPAGESELALKQFACPVSGEHLGAMDVPVKVTAAGQTFYLCCKGCIKDVKDDPAAVVAKLKK
jgi:YHS domain-containing protein